MIAEGSIRSATPVNMKFIASLLPMDYAIGALAMNWNITKKMFTEGGVIYLPILGDCTADMAVARFLAVVRRRRYHAARLLAEPRHWVPTRSMW